MTKKMKLQVSQLPYFISRTSTLLKEGYTFAECIDMLLPYHVKNYEQWVPIFHQDFHNGTTATTIFKRLGVRSQYLLSIELAEASGTLPDTLQLVSEQLHFSQSFKEQIRKLLVYPLGLFIGLIGLFAAFRLKFLPSIQQMMHTRVGDEKATGIEWSKFFVHTPDYIMFCVVFVLLVIAGFLFYMSKKRIDVQVKILLKIPFLQYYWRLALTRQFSRMLGELLRTGFSLQDALELMKKQQHQKQLSYIAAVIHQRVMFGDTLAEAVIVSHLFYTNFEQFIAHGERSGLLGRELILYAELLEDRVQNILSAGAKIVQPLLFIVIAICIIAAYLSILLPMYNMLDVI